MFIYYIQIKHECKSNNVDIAYTHNLACNTQNFTCKSQIGILFPFGLRYFNIASAKVI